jgi:hypothetical protein
MPQIVENQRTQLEMKDCKEATGALHTQEVTGSSPVAPYASEEPQG